jgi:hypothetical protein
MTSRKKRKKIKIFNRKKKTLQVQNIIKTFSQFVNIPQLNDVSIDYYILNDTKGSDTIISTNFKIIENGFNFYYDNLIGSNKLSDLTNQTYTVKLLPTRKQKTTLLKWMDAYIDMYNQILNKIKNIRNDLNKQYKTVFKYNEIDFDLNLNKLKVEFADYKAMLET